MSKDLEALGDVDLMEAYQQGQDAAFAVLYRRHSAKVFGYLVNRLRDRTFAEDVFQKAFLKLHSTRDRYDAAFPFVPWLFTVCKSVMIDSLRERKGIREESNDVALENAVAPEALPQGASREWEGPDLGRLPAAQRQAVEMRYQQELSFEQISKRLETSPANVRQLISRALKRLRVSS